MPHRARVQAQPDDESNISPPTEDSDGRGRRRRRRDGIDDDKDFDPETIMPPPGSIIQPVIHV